MLWGLLMWKWGAVRRGEIRLNRAWEKAFAKGRTLRYLEATVGLLLLLSPTPSAALW